MFKTALLSCLLIFHPVHVTLMSVEYSKKERSLNTYLMVYYDDFCRDYKLLTGSEITIGMEGDTTGVKTKLERYLDDRVKIIDGGRILKGMINSFTLADNELKMNIRYSYRKPAGKLVIRNSILTTIYRDQTNLLILRFKNNEEGVKLTPENPEHEFQLNRVVY
ncbi:MAG: DUF6702 family protein [Bacteroidales bacterium]